MKPLSIRSLAIILAWLFICSASTSGSSAVPANRQVHYYYFAYPQDTFTEYNTVAGEISDLESALGVNVDTSPGGGTLVARGYINSHYPHNVLPSSLLYAHF
jgi:hypothetical protein